MEEKVEATEAKAEGAFVSALKRNNKQIREDRATAIAEDAQVTYRRVVEDLSLALNRLTRKRENMLDMSPDNALSLKLATDFDAVKFVADDLDLGVKIRETEIKLEIATARYAFLFGVK